MKQTMRLTSIIIACCLNCLAADNTVSLAGRWRFQLDRADAGVTESWFARALPDKVTLPGALAEQDIGDDISTTTPWTGGIVDKSWFTAPEYAKYREPGNVKVPFWLQPNKYYKGAAWFQRDIEIPRSWSGKRVVLKLERPHWETRVWVDDRAIGTNNSLATPHEHDLGQLAPGKHTLTIRVDNRLVVDVGHDSHSVTDHTQGNWNGIVGHMALRATPLVRVEDLQAYPSLTKSSVTVRGTIGNATGQTGNGTVAVLVDEAVERGMIPRRDWVRVPVQWQATGGVFQCEVPVPGPKRWDEFHPNFYHAMARIEGQQEVLEAKSVAFGFREVATEGTQLTINGQKTFIRGTLECAIFPKTGYPPTDIESWRKVIKAAKAHGLNLLRFHSWCPPEAAFAAADELGIYFQIECSSWANSSTSLGDGKPIDTWIYQEADRILDTYGNHPSFLLMLYGNEPGGKHHAQFLAKWVDHYKQRDPRRLYSSGAGWPQIPENQFHVTPDPRVQAWGGGLKSRINARPPETMTDYREYIARRTVPVISHEIGQWCVYPNFDEMKKYTGYLKPRNFEIFRETLREHRMDDLARRFLLASGKLQTLCYKEDIESALRTPGMGGFELLDLHDFPGQGTALVGVLDPFWEGKGYVTPEEYSRFCNSTVPLARLAKRVFTTGEALDAQIEVAHFGPEPLMLAVPEWKLVNDAGKAVARGILSATNVPIGNGIALGNISVPLNNVPVPARYKLTVTLRTPKESAGLGLIKAGPAKDAENDWDVWVYPAHAGPDAPATGFTVVNELNEEALAALGNGNKVLLLVPPANVAPDKKHGKVALGFSSIFWNTAWTRRQPPHTLGILCDPSHPLFSKFPTDDCSNWQWWYLVSQAGAMILDDLPPKLRPTVQIIDDWFTARKLGLVMEGKVGRGKLMVCSIDLNKDLENNIVARQFKQSLFDYIGSKHFDPSIEVTPAQIRALYAAPAGMAKLGARLVKVDSEETGYDGAHLIDGNADTMWHTRWTGTKAAFPHEFQVQFARAAQIRGFRFTPRNDNNRNGLIKDYAIYVSDDGKEWKDPVARGAFSRDFDAKTVMLNQPVRVQFVRVVALSGFDAQPYASLAEFEVLGE